MFFPLLIIGLFMLALGAVFPAVYWFNVMVGFGLIALGIKGNFDKQKAAKLRTVEEQKAEDEHRKIDLEWERLRPEREREQRLRELKKLKWERLRPERERKQRLARSQRDFDRANQIAAEQLKSARIALVELLRCNLLRSSRTETVRADLGELSRNHKRLRLEGDYGLFEDEAWHRHLESYVRKKLQISDEQEQRCPVKVCQSEA